MPPPLPPPPPLLLPPSPRGSAASRTDACGRNSGLSATAPEKKRRMDEAMLLLIPLTLPLYLISGRLLGNCSPVRRRWQLLTLSARAAAVICSSPSSCSQRPRNRQQQSSTVKACHVPQQQGLLDKMAIQLRGGGTAGSPQLTTQRREHARLQPHSMHSCTARSAPSQWLGRFR